MVPRPSLPVNPDRALYDTEPQWQKSPTIRPPAHWPVSSADAAKAADARKDPPEEPGEDTDDAPPPGKCEHLKSTLAVLLVIALAVVGYWAVDYRRRDFVEPTCSEVDGSFLKSCEECSTRTSLIPVFGEYEQSWPTWLRSTLYLLGLIWVFMGVGIVCDQFMAGIEEITSTEKVIWHEVHKGARRKFHIKIWNGTIANLSLMALGSSAPEILLSATELTMDNFFAGKLGPSTIVGSAAFNLFMISAVCVSAIPAPEVRRIEYTDVYTVTTCASILAYLWLLVILLAISPDKVELWESLVTLAMFPLLLVLAFVADKGILRRQQSKEKETAEFTERVKQIKARLNKDLSPSTLRLMVQAELAAEQRPKTSRAALRKSTVSAVTGGLRVPAIADRDGKRVDARKLNRELIFGFKDEKHVVLEDAGVLSVKVVANREPGTLCEMRFYTREGTAKEGKRFKHAAGTLHFGHRQTEQSINVPILDNDTWDPDEEFYVVLEDLKVRSSVHAMGSTMSNSHSVDRKASAVDCRFGISQTTVTVLNDDMPGVLSFDADEVLSYEGSTATIGILRSGGSSGRITCDYQTVDGAAIEGKDYEGVNGTLVFEDGETHKTVSVKILVSADHEFEDDETFKVVLSNASPGVKFDANTDGGSSMAVCDVIIAADSRPNCCVRLIRRLCNRDRLRAGFEQWQEQFAGAFFCNGGPEEQAQAGPVDWFFHVLTLFWKLLFALVPPPLFCGGWACFVAALCGIGAVTAVVGEMASLLGCTMGMYDEITAITLVALGTSLPDTFASKAAAQQDDSADNSVGNIMGSNSVNVFLGLGISWTIGALYWRRTGVTSEWESKPVATGGTFKTEYPHYWSTGGGFIYPAGTLLFSVCVYTVTAVLSVALLAWRRWKYGGELGGPARAQRRDSLLLASLWATYVIACSVYTSYTFGQAT